MGKRNSPNTKQPKSKQPKSKKTTRKKPSIYEPLPEGEYIRVLVLQPGGHNDEIICHLEIQSNDSPRRYSAISYVWGDPTNTVNIQCNGLTHPITVSLENALRHFRSPRKTKRLWADALCIDQANDMEKGHQVTHMGKVYENATCVLVWLGLDIDGVAEECFRLIERINEYLDELFVQNGHRFSGLPTIEGSYIIPTDQEGWSTIERLMRFAWFERVWAVQECSLAARCRMFWGSANIDIADVVEISIWCNGHDDIRGLPSAYDSAVLVRSNWMFLNAYRYFRQDQKWQVSRPALRKRLEDYPRSCFTNVLVNVSYLDATNRRDYVYAFLGCIYAKDDAGQSILKVDYTASLDQVYYDVAKTLLSRPSEGPWLLSAVTHFSRDQIMDLSHPSWIPQWDQSTFMMAEPSFSFCASGSSTGYVANFPTPEILQVSGFIFDKIIWRTDELTGSEFSLQPQKREKSADTAVDLYLDRLWRVVASVALDFGLEIHFKDFTLTLLENYYGLGGVEDHDKDLQAYRKVASLLKKHTSSRITTWTAEDYRAATWISLEFQRHAETESIFLTRSGKIGLGRASAIDVGDSCCIVMGATVPFILAPGNEGRYRLVEECYIHGVMYGELLHKFEPTTIEIE